MFRRCITLKSIIQGVSKQHSVGLHLYYWTGIVGYNSNLDILFAETTRGLEPEPHLIFHISDCQPGVPEQFAGG